MSEPTTKKRKQDDDAPKLSLGEHVRWLWAFWRPHKIFLVFLGLFTLVSTSVAVAYPLVLRAVIDRVTDILDSDGEMAEIRTIMLILAAILVGHFISRFYPATRALMNARLERDIRDKVFGELMTKDYHFNNTFRTGDVVTRLTDDLAEFPKVAWFACSGVFRAIESSSKLVFCLAAMVVMSGKLTALAIVPLPVMVWIFYSLRHRMRYYMEASQKSVSKTNDLLESAFTGIKIVKAFSGEEAQSTRLADILRERVRVLMGLIRLQVVMFSLDTFASRLGQMIVIAYGGALVIQGQLSIGTILAFYIYLDMLTGPMMDIPFLFMTGQQAFVSIDRVEEIRAFPVREKRPSGDDLERIDDIAFEGVSFSYDGSRQNLDDIGFRIEAGSRVALVGPVASGKSTVLKLAAGILNPQDGHILVNGKRLSGWEWDSYRRLIGYVPQEGVLFSKSIEENVAFGREAPEDFSVPYTDSEAALRAWTRQCLSLAQMDSDLATLPDGVETVVGQRGTLVSGGQKQRIAIARALAGRPQILLLDDCTAALDAQNEDRFWSDLDTGFPDGICFVVSHRISTIRRADAILVFDDGRLVDQGTHDELVDRCRTYQDFLQTERRKEHLRMVGGTAGEE